MAELVQSHLESMMEEIEEMHRIKLFNKAETRSILKRRREFEYKINGVTKNLQDFKEYIQYEKILLKDIKIRRNKFRVLDRKTAIEFKILRRIKYLYDIALQKFSNDFQFSMSYFKFCKDSVFMQAATHIIQKMLKTFSSKEEVWKEAADWFVKKDLNQALSIVYRGLAIHKKSEKLCSKAIDLELKNVGTNKDAQNLCAKRIETIIESVLTNLNEYNFLLEILETLTLHNFTVGIQKIIAKWLLEKHKDEEMVWHTLAEREFNGHHLEQDNTTTTPNYRLEKCIETYEIGLTQICIGNKSTLWSLYLDFLISLHSRPDKLLGAGKEMLISAFERSSQYTKLSERYFVIWAQLLEDEVKVMEVIDKGLQMVPDSVDLWKLRLKYAVLKDDVQQFNELVKRGTAILENKSTSLWMMALRYHTLNSPDNVINNIYEQAVSKPKDVSDVFKPDFIEWLSLSKGIDAARNKYMELAEKVPHCKELHIVMARIESLELDPNIDQWEKVLLLAVEQFNEHLDFWKMLMELYLRHHRSFEKRSAEFDLSDKLLSVYNNAEKSLQNNELLLANLKKNFDELRNSIDV